MAARGGGGGQEEQSMDLVWWVVIGFVFLFLIWWLFKKYWLQLFVLVRKGELLAIYWSIRWFVTQNVLQAFQEQLATLDVIEPSMVTLGYAGDISTFVGQYLRWPVVVILAIYAYWLYSKNVKMHYRKKYDMRLLAAQEQREWPHINPVLISKINELPLEEGVWAMAEQPLLFCKKRKLVAVQVILPDAESLRTNIKFKLELDVVRAEQVFANQLGRLWQGVDKMPLMRQALFAVFAARGCRDTKVARDLLTQINRSATSLKATLDFKGVPELCNKYIKVPEVQEIIKHHSYEFTIFIDLLLLARTDGVLAAAEFLWLKPRDRILWYVLNCVGRRTYFCEAAGPYAHFLTEKALKRPLSSPMVKEAVNALQQALNDILYTPDIKEREELLKNANVEIN